MSGDGEVIGGGGEFGGARGWGAVEGGDKETGPIKTDPPGQPGEPGWPGQPDQGNDGGRNQPGVIDRIPDGVLETIGDNIADREPHNGNLNEFLPSDFGPDFVRSLQDQYDIKLTSREVADIANAIRSNPNDTTFFRVNLNGGLAQRSVGLGGEFVLSAGQLAQLRVALDLYGGNDVALARAVYSIVNNGGPNPVVSAFAPPSSTNTGAGDVGRGPFEGLSEQVAALFGAPATASAQGAGNAGQSAYGASQAGGSTLVQLVGDVGGQPIYRNAQGQLVDATGAPVALNAHGRPIVSGPTTSTASAAAVAAATVVPTTGLTSSSTAAQASGTGNPFAHNPGGPPPWAPAWGYRGEGKHGSYGHPGGGGEFGRDLVDTVRQILSSTLSLELSNGQVRQFLSQLEPGQVANLLASPTKTLPSVMSALMNVLSRGHGRDDRDALLRLFDSFLAHDPSARDIHDFFRSLSPEQIQHLINHRAEIIGNLAGVPHDVRYAANLHRIASELNALQGVRDPGAERRARTLERMLNDRGQYLYFDNAPNGLLASGRVSQVFGNLSEAKYVGLLALGLNNSMDTFSARAERGQLLQQLAQPLVRDGVAMLVWLERLSSEVLQQYRAMLTAWQARQQAGAQTTFQQALAQAARQLAQETLPGMMLRGDARLTLVGHSFGSLIAKESLNHGAKPDACVFLGVPEERLKKVAAQAGCGETDLYALLNYGDTVDEAAVEEEEPDAVDVSEVEADFDRLDPGTRYPPLEAVLQSHDDYLLEGSPSLARVVDVMLGRRPKLLPPQPQVITLYRSADGTFEDRAVPADWNWRGE